MKLLSEIYLSIRSNVYYKLLPFIHKKSFVRPLDLYDLTAFLLKDKEVLDIAVGGAYDGTHSVQLAKLFPKSRVFAFEPASAAFSLLSAQAIKKPTQIFPVQLALSDDNSKASLNVNVLDSTNSLLRTSQSENAESILAGRGRTLSTEQIQTITLDDFKSKNTNFCCSILKRIYKDMRFMQFVAHVKCFQIKHWRLYLKSDLSLCMKEIFCLQI